MTRAEIDRSAPAELARGTRIAAVVSSYHAELTESMLASAGECLRGAGLAPEALLVVRVPGAFELPVVAHRLARRRDVHAVLAFGVVLKGDTDHDRYIASAVADGLMRTSLETETPVLFGVLTCNTREQAEARARCAAEGGLDKGREVALAAVGVLRALSDAETVGTPTRMRR
jgi:6,7-dimethyl-8-ribityllumazine synthase